MFLLTSLATALVYGWGGVLTVEGVLDIGTVVALTAYLQRLYGPLNQLSGVQIDVMTAVVSFDRVFEVLDLEPMIDDKPGAVDVPAGPARIEFDHVEFRYPTRRRGVARVARVRRGARADAEPHRPPRRVLHGGAGPARRAGGTERRRQDDDQQPGAAPLRRARRGDPHQRPRRTRRHPRVDARDHRSRHAGRAPVPRHDPRQPRLRTS